VTTKDEFPEYSARLRLALRGTKLEEAPIVTYRVSLATKRSRDEMLFVLVGDLDKALLPTTEDLQKIRDYADTLSMDMPDLPPDAVFFPPILAHDIIDGVDVFFLGSSECNIWPGDHDLKSLEDLMGKALLHRDFVVFPCLPTDTNKYSTSDMHLLHLDLGERVKKIKALRLAGPQP
jgi:hypothetical protein